VVECRDQIVSLKADVAKQQGILRMACSHNNSKAFASQSQIDTMINILRQLQSQIPARATSQSVAVKLAKDLAEEPRDVLKELNDTVNELCFLVGDAEQTMKSEEAREIVEKLNKILTFRRFDEIQQFCSGVEFYNLDKRYFIENLGRMSCHLMSSAQLSINRGG
jgi:Mg2+ and Co2+ transporter CorA